ncbi:hypothetical protein D7X96_03350 [Corallococcus interemptor]|uniref:Uncharacterized protein n=1 Tax=Corallococcus interemptor TaxID=2316720 RepID=A0A3A8QZ86_9BACT|nr:hypothetical protein D7X96_03350 [Corallococcus interemptor]
MDVALNLNERYMMSFLPSGQVQATEGLANLLTADDDGVSTTLPFRVGGSVVLHDLGEFDSGTSNLAPPELERAWKVSAVDRCLQVCTASPETKNCDRFKAPPPDPTAVSPEHMCAEGAALYVRLEAASLEGKSVRRDVKLFPVPLFSIAGLWGQERYKFLSPREDGLLTEAKRTFDVWALAAGYTTIVGRNVSIEALAALSASREESEVSVEWCVPNVPVGGDTPGQSFPTTACKNGLVGAPAFQRQATLNLLVGFIDPAKAQWRFAAGPRVTTGGNQITLGLDVPFYLQLAEVLGEGKDKVDYRGLLRITPRVEYELRKEGEDERRFLLVLELLGQRSLFSNALDSISNL